MIGDILQPSHLLFILVVALIVLGPKRLPEAGRALGRGLRDFRNALNTDEVRDQMLSTTTAMSPPPTEAAQTPVPSPPTPGPTATGDQATQTDSYPAFAGEGSDAPTGPAPEPTAPTTPETAASARAADHTP